MAPGSGQMLLVTDARYLPFPGHQLGATLWTPKDAIGCQSHIIARQSKTLSQKIVGSNLVPLEYFYEKTSLNITPVAILCVKIWCTWEILEILQCVLYVDHMH